MPPLQIENGGPILLVQVENEYGSFGHDHAFMAQMHDSLVNAGFTKSVFYTADGPEELLDGSLPGLFAGINFGPGDAQSGFETLKKLRPGGPFFASEYWAGWFNFWGEKFNFTNAQKQADDLAWMLEQGYSVNIYMFHGGTTFGWMNGANSKGKDYRPFITSYDYDSALDESGRLTVKYDLFRRTIEKATGKVPPSPPPISIPKFSLQQSASLWSALPKPILSREPLSMEDIGQSYGYILYRVRLQQPASGELVLDSLHDYAQIYLDGLYMGTLDRRLQRNSLPLNVRVAGTQLDILVENNGRVNFGLAIRGERKGVTKRVTFAGKPVTDWQIYSLPLENLDRLAYVDSTRSGPCFYRGTFILSEIGDRPQKALYAAGPWLVRGTNEVVVFDLKGSEGRTLQGLNYPVLNAPITSE